MARNSALRVSHSGRLLDRFFAWLMDICRSRPGRLRPRTGWLMPVRDGRCKTCLRPSASCVRGHGVRRPPCGRLWSPCGRESRDAVSGQVCWADRCASFFSHPLSSRTLMELVSNGGLSAMARAVALDCLAPGTACRQRRFLSAGNTTKTFAEAGPRTLAVLIGTRPSPVNCACLFACKPVMPLMWRL